MTSKLAQCFLGWSKGKQRYNEPVDDAAVQKVLGPDGQAKFARESHYYDRDVSVSKPFTSREGLMEQFSIYTGVDMRHLGAYFRDPSAILGEDLIVRVNDVYQRHLQAAAAAGLNPVEVRRKAEEALRKLPAKLQMPENIEQAAKAAPEVADLLKLRESWKPFGAEIKALEAQFPVDPVYRDYTSKYFEFQGNGGQLYGKMGASSVVGVLVKNAVGNLVAWNPMIATMNAFEFAPKATSYALMNGHSPAVVIKAMSNLMAKTGGNPFQRVADWEARGIYGVGPSNKNPLAFNDRSEELLRNLSASLGEVMGQPPELAVEKVAFVNRFGNELQPYWSVAGAESVSLMRFAIASNKMYMNFFGQVYKGIKTGDMAMAGKAAGALAMFSVITAIQTGGMSAVPAPLAYLIKQTDPGLYESLVEMDQANPALGISKHIGLDLAEKVQPLGGFGFNVGSSILQTDIQGGFQSIGKVPGDLREGELGTAGARLVDGFLGVGQVARIPGVNLSTKRLSAALVKQLEEDSEINADYLFRAADKLGFKQEE